ncbi:MAG: 5'/3'-nucleotidase SurE [Pseudomonadota bacterium]|jgi:5'-nucleotidase|nr:5'/3'-nucleotidase SurE [Pseudomonadota bacterium]|tara:strand:+ start:3849 stop:4592 length:744 start_codon:yes stop_codon:yes gene_type:complete
MKILITNDDGIDSHITRALHEKLSEKHDCTLIAPAKDKSGQGAAITLRTSVEVTKLDEQIYSVDGTPADCVFMGLMAIMKETPDIVVSGINKGANMGDDVIHSGTLGAAFTARKLKYPPIASSIAGRSFEHFDSSILATEMMLNYVVENYSEEPHEGIVFNVNVPNLPFTEIEGFSFTKLGNRGIPLAPEFKEEDGKATYKIGKSGTPVGELEGTDFESIRNNKVSVTPLYWNMTKLDLIRGKLPNE